MSDTTNYLQLPYILPDQAQKHVTHNEALRRLDALVQLACIDILAQPPAAPREGDRYLVASPGLGVWADMANRIAFFVDGAWTYAMPSRGWTAYLLATENPLVFTGSAWQRLISTMSLDSLGIAATADDGNRLAVASAASLFNHAGSGHQMKINRANEAATGALLFQTNFVGRAEIGMADQNLAMKVSRDGQNWRSAITIDPMGLVRTPFNPACRVNLDVASFTPVNGTVLGFNQFSVNQGGFLISPGNGISSGGRLIIPTSGLYQVQMNASAVTSGGFSLTLLQNQTTAMARIKAPPATANTTVSTSGLFSLSAGDTLGIQFTGTALLEFGPLKTELMLTMV